MKKSKLPLLFLIIFILISFVSCIVPTDNNVETQKNTENQSIKANPFFWGTWVRMDNGQEYEVLETFIVHNYDRYDIEYSDSNTLTVKNLGIFEKESESVIVCNNIPYFRNGGVNLEYSLKLVGFTSVSSGLSVRAAGTNLSGIKGKGKSLKYEDFESNAESDSDGNIKLIAPTANDPQTVTITNGDDIIVVPGLSITNAGDEMGTIALVGKKDYNLKITGTVVKKDNGYLYGNNNNYDMDITITNISNNKCTSSICSIESDDPNLIISSKDGTFLDAFIISTLPEGATKTIKISLQYGKMIEPFVKTGISVIINNPSTGQEWKDYIPLKFFKGLIPITVAGNSTERNDEAALNGFIIYPDGNNQFFSVRNNSYKVLYVPSFGNDKKYMMVFSGATVTSELSDSTEMHYTVSPGTTKVKKIDLSSGSKLKESMLFGGNNHSEENAYNTTEAFQAYLSEGEIDYYSILADGNEYYTPSSKKLYYINYKTAYGEVPSGFYAVEGSTFNETDLPELKQTGMSFNGWYVDGKLVKSGNIVDSFVSEDSVLLTAEWIPIQYSVKYNLGEGTNNPDNPYYFTIESSTITLKEPTLFAHKFEGWYTSSDFEGNVVTEIATGTHENITLWAKWTEIKNQVAVTVSAPNYSDIPNISAPVVNENIITFTAPEEYAEYAWYVDGSNEPYGTSKSLSIDVLTTTLKGGYHEIRLEVKDVLGVYYSAQYEFSFQK